jgi:hypothetical protein
MKEMGRREAHTQYCSVLRNIGISNVTDLFHL